MLSLKKPSFKTPIAAGVLAAAMGLVSLEGAATCLGNEQLKGVNLAGAEFNGRKMPGRIFYDYTYPKASDFEYFADKGANAIRLPVRWGRLQRELYSALDTTEVEQVKKAVAAAKSNGMCLILDIHDYAKYGGEILGTTAVPVSAYLDFLNRLGSELGDPNDVALGLMNEPFKITISEWGAIAKQAVADYREKGHKHLLTVSGGRWSGVHEWFKSINGSSNAETFADLKDPLDRTVLEVHQYADEYYSGTKFESCHEPDKFNNMFARITEWAATNDQRLFMGEFGTPASEGCMASLDRMLSLMTDKPEWFGWTYWAAGSWWGDYPLSVHPRNGVDAPQMAVIEPYFGADLCPDSEARTQCPMPPEDVRFTE